MKGLSATVSKDQMHRWRYARIAALLIGLLLLGFASQLQAQTWKTVWAPSFGGTGYPSTNDWNYDQGNNNGWGNKELENYCAPWNNSWPCSTSNPNIYLDGNGNLVIRAINNGGQWTSGRMNTAGHHDIQYGRFEANIALPNGAGLWPAFWMLGSNIGAVGWPACGEIDIMENVPQMGQSTIQSSLHGANGFNTGNQTGLSSGDWNFHVYGTTWWQRTVQFYVDDFTRPFVTLTPSSSGGTWEFDNGPFFTLLNLAVGGNWPGPPNNNTPNPAYMVVNTLRVMQFANGGIDTNAWYQVVNKTSNLCVDDAAWGTSNGTTLQQWACGNQQANQEWGFRPAQMGGYDAVFNRNASSLVWDDTNGSMSNGNGMQLWSYGYANTNQEWQPQYVGNELWRFVNLKSGLCLDNGGSTSNGARLTQWQCIDGNTNQEFTLVQQP
jgi:beta-glucanase (GH16 family)